MPHFHVNKNFENNSPSKEVDVCESLYVHMLFSCVFLLGNSYSLQVSNNYFLLNDLLTIFPNGFNQFNSFFFSITYSLERWATLAWSIWNARNKFYFGQRQVHPKSILNGGIWTVGVPEVDVVTSIGCSKSFNCILCRVLL